jgi:1,3-beta-galactosyl-N-acetylhexosamine phosphorylase
MKNELTHGGFTLPSQAGMDKETMELARKWGADAIRDSDGTVLSDDLLNLGLEVYSTLCLIRHDQEWARKHPAELQQMYLVSARKAGPGGDLEIPLLEQYFDQQFAINWDADPWKYWEVIDRTSGETVQPVMWSAVPQTGSVLIRATEPFHEYTVTFLAYQIWETTSMYNHITNNWGDRPHQMPVDPRQPRTRAHLKQLLQDWIAAHPGTGIVRFTSIAYQFTVMRAANGKRMYRDWAGYHGTVSPLALDQFEARNGYRIRPETFVEGGYRAHADQVPSREYLDWIAFTHEFLLELSKEWVDLVHAAGKKAYVFYCDHYIGTEPYSPRFAEIGFDGLISPAMDGAECRKNADCPGSMVKELRLYPYFFPTEGGRPVFAPGGDPVADCRHRWQLVRRALLRRCVDRIGYGGYLDLVMQYPAFLDEVETVTNQFRFIKHHGRLTRPYHHGITVGVLSAWGKARAWHTESAANFGTLEVLAGLPFEVRFLSFDEITDGVPEGIDVLLNYGPAGSSWSGGENWGSPEVVASVRRFVRQGGGLVGIHEPTAFPQGGRVFQLADLFGVEKNNVFQKNIESFHMPEPEQAHFITAGIDPDALRSLAAAADVTVLGPDTRLLAGAWDRAALTARDCGAGRAVYVAKFGYSAAGCALLKRAILWAGGRDAPDGLVPWDSLCPDIESAFFPETSNCILINNAGAARRFGYKDGSGALHALELGPYGMAGFTVMDGRLTPACRGRIQTGTPCIHP